MNLPVRNILLLLLLLTVAGMHLAAQQKSTKGEKTGTATNHKKIMYPSVYLGQYELAGGAVKKADFDRLLKQGLTSKDSMGYKYKVVGFEFDYYERQLYEDSIGNLKVMTDILSEYCPGDTFSGNVAYSIYERSKPGDTVIFDRITVLREADPQTGKAQMQDPILAKGLKVYITR